MCGIVGVYDYQQRQLETPPPVFDQMVDSLAHRGPDGRGVWRRPGLALGHRRLAILDPTPAGAQPMLWPDHDLAVTFNGEIYNFREIHEELTTRGYVLRTNCDTEVILAAYAEWGPAAVERFNGIFAFALWDGRRRRLWLVRDRLGVKPLYYTLQGNQLRFASEPKAILADPTFERRPNWRGLDSFLSFGFIPAPETGFAELQQLPAGHELIIEHGAVTQRQYWTLRMGEEPRSADDALEQFGERFQQAVRRQLVSDVPLGGFLSGGIDSAAVVTEMTRSANTPVRTFSAGFAAATFDERDAAAATAQLIGTQHSTLEIDLNLEQTVDSYLAQCDDPFADSSSLAVYHLCRVAREQVTVALSGDGADELLAGYPTYSATQLAASYRWLPGWSRKLVQQTVAALPVTESRYSLQQFASRFVLGAEEPEGRDFSSWRVHFREREKQALCRADSPLTGHDPLAQYAACYRDAPGATTRLKRMLHADLAFYLPNDMLVKVDRMSMAHGLEVRVPFLDHEFVEFCANLPGRYLAKLPFPSKNKLILRRHLHQRLGQNVAQRKKTGFNIPIEQAMRTSLWPRLYETLSTTRFMQEGPFDVPKMLDYAAQHVTKKIDAGHALFSALVLADWWQRWLKP